MKPTDIDDALGREPFIEPSARFRAQVMQAVHAQAAARRRRALSLNHLWPAAALAAVVLPLLAAVRLLDAQGGNEALADATQWLLFTLTGTLAAAWWYAHDTARR
jgi:hypothetical protein